MRTHWFSHKITDNTKEAATMLKRYLNKHPNAKIELYVNPYSFTDYIKLITDEDYQTLDINFDTGFSPLRYVKRKPKDIEPSRSTPADWINRWTE